MKTVIIAEKPSVAANIAGVVQASKKDGYFEGEKYIVTYAFGLLPFIFLVFALDRVLRCGGIF